MNDPSSFCKQHSAWKGRYSATVKTNWYVMWLLLLPDNTRTSFGLEQETVLPQVPEHQAVSSSERQWKLPKRVPFEPARVPLRPTRQHSMQGNKLAEVRLDFCYYWQPRNPFKAGRQLSVNCLLYRPKDLVQISRTWEAVPHVAACACSLALGRRRQGDPWGWVLYPARDVSREKKESNRGRPRCWPLASMCTCICAYICTCQWTHIENWFWLPMIDM